MDGETVLFTKYEFCYYLDRQRQAERKQQEIDREAERKRKYIGGGSSSV